MCGVVCVSACTCACVMQIIQSHVPTFSHDMFPGSPSGYNSMNFAASSSVERIGLIFG